MKTKYKYIEFEFLGTANIWTIKNWRYKQYLGQLNYIEKWKQWELAPNDNTGWTMDCLADIIDFVKQRIVYEQWHKLNTFNFAETLRAIAYTRCYVPFFIHKLI